MMLRLGLQETMAGLLAFLYAIKSLSKHIFPLYSYLLLPMYSQQVPLLEESLHPLHDYPLLLARSLTPQI